MEVGGLIILKRVSFVVCQSRNSHLLYFVKTNFTHKNWEHFINHNNQLWNACFGCCLFKCLVTHPFNFPVSSFFLHY